MVSFWRSSPGVLDNHRSTVSITFGVECDIIIIGAGYSGASLVTHMLSVPESRDKSIVVLEDLELCPGATGRNWGHLKPDVYNLCSGMATKHEIDVAAEIVEFELANLEALQDYVIDNNVDCDFIMNQTVDVQLSEEHNSSLKRGFDDLASAGVSGIKGANGAFKYTTGHLWPYKLIHHMFSRTLSHEHLNLQTNTPVTNISYSPHPTGKWIVTTSRGSVRGQKVIISTNAYTALLPEYHEKIIPYRAICIRIVVPTPPMLADSYSLRSNLQDFDYLTPQPDGSIIVGGARSAYFRHTEDCYGSVDDTNLIDRAKDYFDEYMQKTLSWLGNSGAYTAQIWTGSMGYSSDALPHVGHVPGRQNIFIMGGFTGHGIPQVPLGWQGYQSHGVARYSIL
ncbi:hypothetical protein FVEN_g12119 [Fusarium venenatum]|nr:hypothetical protein FVEN_g12119 [Fusarium venenatum]